MSVLIAKEAPDFTAPAVMPGGVIEDHFKLSGLRGKYVVLFFWPLDFTFVCPTEIIAHDRRIAQFKERNTEVVGISIDSQFTPMLHKKDRKNLTSVHPQIGYFRRVLGGRKF
jgi:peroxiredoxin 2/4